MMFRPLLVNAERLWGTIWTMGSQRTFSIRSEDYPTLLDTQCHCVTPSIVAGPLGCQDEEEDEVEEEEAGGRKRSRPSEEEDEALSAQKEEKRKRKRQKLKELKVSNTLFVGPLCAA